MSSQIETKSLVAQVAVLALTGTPQLGCGPEIFPVPGPRALGVRYAPAESVPSPLTTQLSRKEFAGI